jgi:signal transduction histidine kinase
MSQGAEEIPAASKSANLLRRALLVVAVLGVGVSFALRSPSVAAIFDTGSFMPHGHCYLWLPSMVWLQVSSNTVIGVSYVVISSLLVYFVWKRKDLPFDWMFMAFGLFIVACGVGHFIDVITLWRPMYWLAGIEKGFTALVSVLTAILLLPLLPKALALPSPEDLRRSNLKLQAEIAERKLAERKLAGQTEELERALRLLKEQQAALLRSEKLAAVGQLAASVGHELRNPLAAVRNAATYIAKRQLATPSDGGARPDPRIAQFFEIIERELTASGKIISDLLDFARERAPSLQPCPMRPLVDEAISLVPRGAVRVENRVPAELPVPALDRQQFRQVLINLIQNAVDATPSGCGEPVVIAATGGGGMPWRITVTDHGCGIADAVQSKIFEPLFTTKTKGTGLGLAIVQNIIKVHLGQISVSSQLDSGTTFTITLPAPRALLAATEAAS